MSSLFDSAGRLLENNERFVLATVIRSAGSTPRAVGAKMVVRADGQIIDTIGGGLLEAQVIEAAAGVFETGAGKIIHFDLAADDSAGRDESICGGTLDVLVERVEATDANRRLYAALAETIRSGRRNLQFALLEPLTDGGCASAGGSWPTTARWSAPCRSPRPLPTSCGAGSPGRRFPYSQPGKPSVPDRERRFPGNRLSVRRRAHLAAPGAAGENGRFSHRRARRPRGVCQRRTVCRG